MSGKVGKILIVGPGTGGSPVISIYGIPQMGHLSALLAWLSIGIIGRLVSSFLPLQYSQIVQAFSTACFYSPGQLIRRCGQVFSQP